jgi:hypothetical protein
MGPGAVIYVPSFIKIGSGIQTLIGWDTQAHTHKRAHTHAHTHRQQRDLISLLCFFKIRRLG